MEKRKARKHDIGFSLHAFLYSYLYTSNQTTFLRFLYLVAFGWEVVGRENGEDGADWVHALTLSFFFFFPLERRTEQQCKECVHNRGSLWYGISS